MSEVTLPEPDRPWLMRTYSGHSTAKASNELYRTNLAKGQTGLSIAFDLPTQTGYDPDDPQARGEVGKVGVPVAHLGHMRELLDGIPPGEMNTSMTINATAAWLLGLYVANAEHHGVESKRAAGHDAERHRQGVPVPRHLHLPAAAAPPADRRHDRLLRRVDPEVEPDERVLATTCRRRGRRRSRRSPTRLATAIGVLDAVRESGQVARGPLPAGVRVDQLLRQRRHPLRRGDLQDAGLHRAVGPHRPRALRRHRRQGAALPLRRAGQQPRPHRGAAREQRAAHRARDARRHAVEATPGPARSSCRRGTRRSACPARGTSSGRCACSRCWPTRPTCSSTTTSSTARTSSRAGPPSWSRRRAAELDDVLALGGAFEAIDELKGRLVAQPHRADAPHRVGELTVVGVNRFTETARRRRSAARSASSRSTPRCEARDDRRRAGVAGRAGRRRGEAVARRAARVAAESTRTSCRPRSTSPTPAARPASGPACCARCSASTGRRPAWPPRPARPAGRAGCAPSPSGSRRCPAGRPASSSPSPASTATPNGAEQIAVAARDAGMEVDLPGHPAHARADRGGRPRRGRRRHRPVDPVGQPPRARARGRAPRAASAGVDAPVVVGGIIPEEDRQPPARRRRGRRLHAQGLRARPHHGRDRRPGRRAPRRLTR